LAEPILLPQGKERKGKSNLGSCGWRVEEKTVSPQPLCLFPGGEKGKRRGEPDDGAKPPGEMKEKSARGNVHPKRKRGKKKSVRKKRKKEEKGARSFLKEETM